LGSRDLDRIGSDCHVMLTEFKFAMILDGLIAMQYFHILVFSGQVYGHVCLEI